MLRFRCHVGHAYSAESLDHGQSQMLESALWSAVRALEEQMILARRIIERARKANHTRAVNVYERRAKEAERNSNAIRQLLLSNQKGGIAETAAEIKDEVRVS
jgi:two-component system chemotaxis response regulator CheB